MVYPSILLQLVTGELCFFFSLSYHVSHAGVIRFQKMVRVARSVYMPATGWTSDVFPISEKRGADANQEERSRSILAVH